MSELWHCLILLGVLEVFWFYATLIIFVDNSNNNNNNNNNNNTLTTKKRSSGFEARIESTPTAKILAMHMMTKSTADIVTMMKLMKHTVIWTFKIRLKTFLFDSA